MSRPVLALLPLVAFAATAACGTFPAADWAPAKPVRIGGSEATASDGYYADASAAILDRDYGRALDLLQMARRGHESDPRILNAFGVVYDKLGRFDLSERYYAQALAADPQSAIVRGNLAYSQQLQQHWRAQNGGPGETVVAQQPASPETGPPASLAAAPPLPTIATAPSPNSAPAVAPKPQPTALVAARPAIVAHASAPAPAAMPRPAAAVAFVEAASSPVLAAPAREPAAHAEPKEPAVSPATLIASDPGPRPYAVAFMEEPVAPSRSLRAPLSVSETGPRPYAIAFLDEPARPAAAPSTPPRKTGPAPRAGSLVLLDASGRADRVRSIRTRLSQLGWSAGGSVPRVAPVASRTVIRFPTWRLRVAQALARTLPGPARLQTCGRSCNFIQVLFGADVSRWRFAPGAVKDTRGKAKT